MTICDNFPLKVLLRVNLTLKAFLLIMTLPNNWPLVYNRNTIRGCTSVLISYLNIEEQDEDIPKVIRKWKEEEEPGRYKQETGEKVEKGLGDVKTQVVVAITLTQISLYIRVDKENLLESSLSGPVEQSQIPLRGYEVKTRRTWQSSLYELPSYLYKYTWLC